MKTSNRGIELIKEFEKLMLEAYRCPAGAWTIGWGHTGGVKQGQKIGISQAISFLNADIVKFEKLVSKYDSIYHFTQNEFDALVSFAFNIGNIDGLTNKGKRTKSEIAEKFLAYNKSGNEILGGLVRRRRLERELFLGVSLPGVSYSGHIQSIGDTPIYKNGQTCGSVGMGLRLEGVGLS